MKRSLLYILLITYAFSVLKPALPIVSDAMAHVLLFHHHLSTVHMVNGQQHVHYEIIREAKKESKESGYTGINKVYPTDDHPVLSFNSKPDSCNEAVKIFSPETSKLFCRSAGKNYPPPRCQII